MISIVSDWVLGEFSASGRSRSHLLAVLQSLYRMAGTPIGQAKLARESGLSNNTMAQGYIDLLADLLTIIPAFPYDPQRKIAIFRNLANIILLICSRLFVGILKNHAPLPT